jgi:hypothetical protein
MINFKIIKIAIGLCVGCATGFAQVKNVVDEWQNKYQTCLTKGINAFGCSKLHLWHLKRKFQNVTIWGLHWHTRRCHGNV